MGPTKSDMLKKCDNELCDHLTQRHYEYCCAPCELAAEKHYEIHEEGPLGHTVYCMQRHEERGPVPEWE